MYAEKAPAGLFLFLLTLIHRKRSPFPKGKAYLLTPHSSPLTPNPYPLSPNSAIAFAKNAAAFLACSSVLPLCPTSTRRHWELTC